MKNMKLGILAFAALGLVGMLMEFEVFKLLLTHPFAEGAFGLIFIAGFVVPLIMALLGLTKPPMQMWQAGVALVASAVWAIKFKIWDALPHIGDAPTSMKIVLIGNIGGIVCAALAVAKPESKA